jgi:hypothetical protein
MTDAAWPSPIAASMASDAMLRYLEAGALQLTHIKQVVEVKVGRRFSAAAASAAAALCDCHAMFLELGFEGVDGEALHSLRVD